MFNELIACNSVPAFLTPAECRQALKSIHQVLEQVSPSEFEVDERERSIHSIEGHDLESVKNVFEPAGRREYEHIPADVVELLGRAVERALPAIQLAFPSACTVDDWAYVSYRADQFITPHVDYPQNDDDPAHSKICGLSLQLNDDFEGGEFFVETASTFDLYVPGDDGVRVRDGAEYSSEWYRELPRTRWVASPRMGQVLLYGSALTHGTLPVRSGRVEKLIGFLLA